MNLYEQVQLLAKSILEKTLPPKDHEFGSSLVKSFAKNGNLTDKQGYWVGELLKRVATATTGKVYWLKDGKPVASPLTHEAPAPVAAPAPKPDTDIQVGDFSKVLAMFESAKASKLQKPKITMKTKRMHLTFAPYKGGLKVVKGEKFGQWYGTVTTEGVWTPPHYASQEEKDYITILLTELGSNPVATTAKYGKLSGKCVFCNHPLTDGLSVKLGYGPVCARKWGLPH